MKQWIFLLVLLLAGGYGLFSKYLDANAEKLKMEQQANAERLKIEQQANAERLKILQESEKRQERLAQLYPRMGKVQQELFELNAQLKTIEKECEIAEKNKQAADDKFFSQKSVIDAELKKLDSKIAYYSQNLAELKRFNEDDEFQCFVHCVPSNADLSRHYRYNEAKTFTGNFLPCHHDYRYHNERCRTRFVCNKHHRSWYLPRYERYRELKRKYHRISGLERQLVRGKEQVNAQIAKKTGELSDIEFSYKNTNESVKKFEEVKEKRIRLKRRIKNKEQELAGIQSMLQIYENGKAAGSENEAVRQ